MTKTEAVEVAKKVFIFLARALLSGLRLVIRHITRGGVSNSVADFDKDINFPPMKNTGIHNRIEKDMTEGMEEHTLFKD
jgi:hypothetical protein